MSWIEVAGTIAGILTIVLSYITWFERKRDKKLEEEKKRSVEKEDNLVQKIRNVVRKDTKETLDERLSKYVTIDEHMVLRKIVEKSEEARLASEITAYAEDLRNKLPKSAISYKHISKAYDKYKSAGANSYIQAEFAYIQKVMGERGENI